MLPRLVTFEFPTLFSLNFLDWAFGPKCHAMLILILQREALCYCIDHVDHIIVNSHFMPSALHLASESVLKLRLKPEQSHTLTLYNTNYNSKFLNTSLQTTFVTLVLCSWSSGKRTLMFLGWVQYERATYSCPWENTGYYNSLPWQHSFPYIFFLCHIPLPRIPLLCLSSLSSYPGTPHVHRMCPLTPTLFFVLLLDRGYPFLPFISHGHLLL